MHYDNKNWFTLLQMKSKKCIRMKVSGLIYRSDLLIIFVMLVAFSFVFNFLSWLHEQPDGRKIDLSYSRQQALIDEWKQKHKELELEKQELNEAVRKGRVQVNNDNLEDGEDGIKKYGIDDNVDGVIDDRKGNRYKYEFEDLESEKVDKKQEVNLAMKDFEVDIVRKDFDDYNAVYVLREKDDRKNSKKESHKDIAQKADNLDENAVNIAAPLGGKLVGGPAQCTIYDMGTHITTDYECLNIAIKPTVKVCLYPNEEDVHISQHIRNTGIWEPHIVKEFQNILFSNPDYGFIDIGEFCY